MPPAKPRRSLEARGVAAMLGATVAWSVGNIFVKVQTLPGLTFAFYRLWGGLLAYVAISAMVRRRPTVADLRASLPGGVAFGLYMVLLYSALQATSIADVTIVLALQPMLVLVVAGRLFGERIGMREVALAGVALAGVVVVVLGSAGTPGWSLGGDVLAALALFAFVGFWLGSKDARSRHHVDALAYVTCTAAVGALLATPVALIGGPLELPTGRDWLWLGLTILIPSVLAHWLAAWGHRFVPVWRSSLIQLAIPVVSVALAWVFLDEPLTLLAALGGAMVLGALALVILSERGERAHRPVEDPLLEPPG